MRFWVPEKIPKSTTSFFFKGIGYLITRLDRFICGIIPLKSDPLPFALFFWFHLLEKMLDQIVQ